MRMSVFENRKLSETVSFQFFFFLQRAMACVWLVGETDNQVRVLVDRRPVQVKCLADVHAAFARGGFVLHGSTGYILQSEDITAEVNPEASLEQAELKDMLADGLWLLYRVGSVVDTSDRRVRQLVDVCLSTGSSVDAAQHQLQALAGIPIGHSRVERMWRETLILSAGGKATPPDQVIFIS
jgi:hypothetical protein